MLYSQDVAETFAQVQANHDRLLGEVEAYRPKLAVLSFVDVRFERARLALLGDAAKIARDLAEPPSSLAARRAISDSKLLLTQLKTMSDATRQERALAFIDSDCARAHRAAVSDCTGLLTPVLPIFGFGWYPGYPLGISGFCRQDKAAIFLKWLPDASDGLEEALVHETVHSAQPALDLAMRSRISARKYKALTILLEGAANIVTEQIVPGDPGTPPTGFTMTVELLAHKQGEDRDELALALSRAENPLLLACRSRAISQATGEVLSLYGEIHRGTSRLASFKEFDQWIGEYKAFVEAGPVKASPKARKPLYKYFDAEAVSVFLRV